MIRKNFLRSSLILLLFYLHSCTPKDKVQEYALNGQTMGTVYNIKIVSNSLEDKILQNIKISLDSSLKQVNQQMSTYIADSEISLFNNHKHISEFKVSAQFAKVLKEALYVYEISSGAFDITVNPLVNLWGFGSKTKKTVIPTDDAITSVLKTVGSNHISFIGSNTIKKENPAIEIDLSAIAKGYGVDAVSRVLETFNLQNYMVEIGGEIFAKGSNIRNEKWKIGIDKPKYLAMPGQDLQQIISISNVGVATSGDYRNYFELEGKIYSHTINPKTGKPVTHNLASVTIVAPNCMLADALATAVLVMGTEKGLKFIESLDNVEGYLIKRIDLEKFEVLQSPGFSKYLN